MALPDFLIIGAMKCGTSTLQAQLAAQPGIFMTTPKEPNFFSDDPVYEKGMDWYEALYDSALPGDLKGEASTHYTKLPTWPQTVSRLKVAVPAPRLIYLIRDPVARAVSHYIHEWSEGRLSVSPAEAFESHRELTDYGRYGMQIAPFAQAFGTDAIHLISLEAMTARPEEVIAGVGAFLGRTDLAWNHEMEAQNVSAQRVRDLPFQRLLIANPIARAIRRALIPKSWREKVRRARSITERPDLPADIRARLERVYAEDRKALAALFPGHPALTEAYPFLK